MIVLNSERPAPNFRLPSSGGEAIVLNDYRHRQPVVLFLAHGAACPSCRERLRAFAASYDAYREWDAEVLAVIPESPDAAWALVAALGLPFPVLSDEEGRVRQAYTGQEGQVGVFVLDRYNAPQAWWLAGEAGELLTPGEALDWVQLGELACPECGVSEWPLL